MQNFVQDPELGPLLLELGRTIFPLQEWLNDTGHYQPDDAAALPWRQSPPLQIEDFHVLQRLSAMIEDGADEKLRQRWLKIAAAPRWMEPLLPYPSNWRGARGLDETPVFAPADSDNVATTTEELRTRQRLPRARREFYELCWPWLLKSHAVHPTPDQQGWVDYATQLFTDTAAGWGKEAPVKSSDFMKRLAKDLAICLLDMENPTFSDSPADKYRQRAVLMEAGEYRSRANSYSPRDVQKRVDELERQLASKLGE